MSELPEHHYERTLVASSIAMEERLVIWVEGTNMKLSFNAENYGFGIAGGPVGTNTGISFTKEQLLEIAGKMKEGAKLKVAACNYLNIPELLRGFERYNNMVKCGPHEFKPKDNKLKELDSVEILIGSLAGTRGTIVHVYPDKDTYEVELFTSSHATMGVYTFGGEEIKKLPKYVLKATTVGNPDYRQNPDARLYGCPDLQAEVDLTTYQKVLAWWIANHDIGSGNLGECNLWEGDKKVARVSYNGRLWPPDRGWDENMKSLVISDSGELVDPNGQ